MAGYFFFQLAGVASSFWLPTFLKRLSGLPPASVSKLLMIPAIPGVIVLLANAWHSDRAGERKWHTVIPVACAGFVYLSAVPAHSRLTLAFLFFTLAISFNLASVPGIWAMPTAILSGAGGAAALGLISSVSQAGAFIGPYLVGYLNERSHSILPSIAAIGSSYLGAAFIFCFVRVQTRTAQDRCPRPGHITCESPTISAGARNIVFSLLCSQYALRCIPAISGRTDFSLCVQARSAKRQTCDCGRINACSSTGRGQAPH